VRQQALLIALVIMSIGVLVTASLESKPIYALNPAPA